MGKGEMGSLLEGRGRGRGGGGFPGQNPSLINILGQVKKIPIHVKPRILNKQVNA